MGAISNKLRAGEDGALTFWRPGCKDTHTIRHGYGQGSRWGWNGNADSPTFTPSVLVRSGHHVPGHDSDSCWCKYNAEHPDDPAPFARGICHSFVTDGQIQFLNDCTHELSGQTVPLPDLPETVK